MELSKTWIEVRLENISHRVSRMKCCVTPIDVTKIEIDLRLSTLKLRHGKLMKDLYEYLLTDKGKSLGKSIILSGWRSAGTLDCVKTLEMARFSPLTPTLIRILRTVLFGPEG